MKQIMSETLNTIEDVKRFVNANVLNNVGRQLVNITTEAPVGRQERYVVWYICQF